MRSIIRRPRSALVNGLSVTNHLEQQVAPSGAVGGAWMILQFDSHMRKVRTSIGRNFGGSSIFDVNRVNESVASPVGQHEVGASALLTKFGQ